MGSFFNADSPFMQFMSRLVDIVWLSLLTIICSIPIFTAGAAITSLYYVFFKMIKKEESYITKMYFREFKQSFKHATGAWILVLVMAAVFWCEYSAVNNTNLGISKLWNIFILFMFTLCMFIYTYLFALIARFENNLKKTLLNALAIGITRLNWTIPLLILVLMPVALAYFFPKFALFGSILIIGFLSYLKAIIYLKVFKRYELEKQEAESTKTVG